MPTRRAGRSRASAVVGSPRVRVLSVGVPRRVLNELLLLSPLPRPEGGGPSAAAELMAESVSGVGCRERW